MQKSKLQLSVGILPAGNLWLPHEIPPELMRPAHSFVFNFEGMLWTQVAFLNLSLIDTGGVLRTILSNAYAFNSNSGIGVTTFGLRVGSGNAPPTIAQSALTFPFGQGTGENVLEHAATTFVSPYTIGNTAYMAVQRSIRNGWDTFQTVGEIGWYVRGGGMQWFFMIARDIFAPAVIIGPGVTLQFTYTLAVTA